MFKLNHKSCLKIWIALNSLITFLILEAFVIPLLSLEGIHCFLDIILFNFHIYVGGYITKKNIIKSNFLPVFTYTLKKEFNIMG